MRSVIPRLKIIFLGIFALGCAAIWVYHLVWVWPGDRCVQAGGWWDNDSRVCGQPIYIPDITGRDEGETRQEASMRQAAERAAEERRSRGAY